MKRYKKSSFKQLWPICATVEQLGGDRGIIVGYSKKDLRIYCRGCHHVVRENPKRVVLINKGVDNHGNW
jgi:hypothetical protein